MGFRNRDKHQGRGGRADIYLKPMNPDTSISKPLIERSCTNGNEVLLGWHSQSKKYGPFIELMTRQ